MNFRFLFLALGIVCLAVLPLRSQEKLDAEALNKKRTFELLEKAKEEYRIFFKKPDTPYEFWAAIKFEMDLGKFDLAALHMKLLLEKDAKEVDPALVKIEAAEGMSAFLRLRQVREWSDHPPFQKEAEASVEKLLERVTEAVHTHLSDPVRINKFIKQLDAPTPEERTFAYVQLARSRERAVPHLIEAMRVNHGKSLFARLRETMLRLGPETVPVYLEVFKAANEKDYRDIELRATLLDIVKARDDRRVIPYLWHMYASKRYPDVIRTKAKETLASLLRIPVDEVAPAKESLTILAERYYQHKMALPKAIEIYEWDGEKINTPAITLTPASAEKFYCERYAREALDLDPSHLPAQVVLLSLTLERYFKSDMDQILMRPMPPKLQQLLTTIDADLVMRVLERGMNDRQTPVIVPTVLALGERAEQRAVRVNESGQPRALARALYYPDRRVQFASMISMLRMPEGSYTPAVSHRVVDIARRFLAAGVTPKALLINVPEGQGPAVRKIVADLGYDSAIAKGLNDAIQKGKASADFDLVVLFRGVGDANFQHAYGQLRQHYDLGGLPMLVVVETGPERKIAKLEDQMLADDASVAKAQVRWEIDKQTLQSAPAYIRKILMEDRAERSEADLRNLHAYFRYSWEKNPRTLELAPPAIRQILFTDPKRRTESDRRDLEIYFRSGFSEFKPIVDQIAAARLQPDPAKATRNFVASNPNALVVSEEKFQSGKELRTALDDLTRHAGIVPLTPNERSLFGRASLDFLWRMARGEIKGFDVTPALDVVLLQFGSPETALQAVEILGRMPGKEYQYKLAGLVTDPARDRLRIAATQELNRNIQLHGLSLDKKQVADLKLAHQEAPEGTPLRAELNVTMSMIARATISRTGTDLLRFRIDPPIPPPPAPPKEDKKDN